MKIVVDRDLCEANQVCMRIAPDVFRVDETDRLHILVDDVGPELRERVERAVKRCPRQALALVEAPLIAPPALAPLIAPPALAPLIAPPALAPLIAPPALAPLIAPPALAPAGGAGEGGAPELSEKK
jgi:ferredoxin